MQKEIIRQAISIFDTVDKWNAFTELANHKENIKWEYLSKVKPVLHKYFMENPLEGWVCEPWGNQLYDLRWYLKDFGKSSLALAVGWTFEFHLHVEDTINFDSNVINELLKSDYSLLMASFDRVDRQFENNSKAIEARNYSFGSSSDSNFDNSQIDKLAWYAGNETEKLAIQIIQKVERFRKDDNLTKLLYEVNQKSRKV